MVKIRGSAGYTGSFTDERDLSTISAELGGQYEINQNAFVGASLGYARLAWQENDGPPRDTGIHGIEQRKVSRNTGLLTGGLQLGHELTGSEAHSLSVVAEIAIGLSEKEFWKPGLGLQENLGWFLIEGGLQFPCFEGKCGSGAELMLGFAWE